MYVVLLCDVCVKCCVCVWGVALVMCVWCVCVGGVALVMCVWGVLHL